jgi:PST family polysaccharide transporter
MGLGLPVAQSVGAATAAGDAESERRTVSTAMLAIAAAVVVLVAIGMIAADPIARLLLGPHADAGLMRWALLGAGGLAFQGTIQGVFSGRSDVRATVTYALVGNIVATIAVLALLPKFGLRGAVIGAGCFFPAAMLGTLWLHRRDYASAFRAPQGPRFDRARWRGMIKVAGTALALALLDQGTMLAVRTHYARTLGYSANGLFQAALALSQQVGAVFYAYLGSYAFGKVAGATGLDGVKSYTQKQWSALITVAIGAFAFAMIAATPLLRLLYSNQFDPAQRFMAWTLFGEFAKVCMQTWVVGALPLGGLRLYFPVGVSYPIATAAAYVIGTRLGLGDLSLPMAYACAGVFALLVSGVMMTRRGVPLTPRGFLLLVLGFFGLLGLAYLRGR